MIKITNQHELNTIMKTLDASLPDAYVHLESSNKKIIEQIECLQNKNSNILIVQIQNQYLKNYDAKTNKYVGILVSDLIQTILIKYPDLISEDKNINQLRNYKSRISNFKTEDYSILGYVTNQNKLQITMHQNLKLSEDISNTIILFPSYDSEIIMEFIENFQEENISDTVKNQIEDNIITPLLKFNEAYNKLQGVAQIVSAKGIIYFDEPKSLLEILDHYHTGSKTLALLNKLIKPSKVPDVVFSDIKCFCGQRNINIEQMDHLFLESWDTNLDFTCINNMVNQAYFLRRKVNDSVKIRNYDEDLKSMSIYLSWCGEKSGKIRNDKPSVKEEKRVHKKAVYRV